MNQSIKMRWMLMIKRITIWCLVNIAEKILKPRSLAIMWKTVQRNQNSANFVNVRLAVRNIWTIYINAEAELDNAHFAIKVYL